MSFVQSFGCLKLVLIFNQLFDIVTSADDTKESLIYILMLHHCHRHVYRQIHLLRIQLQAMQVRYMFATSMKSTTLYKCWIVIFTCSSTRAVRLDIIPSCSAASCIRALRRFFARRGVSSSILSDNRTQFVVDDTQHFVLSHGIKWHYNPPTSPWWGGLFERLIRCVKQCLKKVIQQTRLNYYEELQTVLSEI